MRRLHTLSRDPETKWRARAAPCPAYGAAIRPRCSGSRLVARNFFGMRAATRLRCAAACAEPPGAFIGHSRGCGRGRPARPFARRLRPPSPCGTGSHVVRRACVAARLPVVAGLSLRPAALPLLPLRALSAAPSCGPGRLRAARALGSPQQPPGVCGGKTCALPPRCRVPSLPPARGAAARLRRAAWVAFRPPGLLRRCCGAGVFSEKHLQAAQSRAEQAPDRAPLTVWLSSAKGKQGLQSSRMVPVSVNRRVEISSERRNTPDIDGQKDRNATNRARP